MKKKTTKKKQTKNPVAVSETKVTKFLDEAKVKYRNLEHKIVYTAHDTAQTTRKKLSEIAKVVLVKVTGPEPVIARMRQPRLTETKQSRLPRSAKASLAMTDFLVLIVLPAGKYVDLTGIKKALKAKKVSMATEKDIVSKLKTKVGLLHPFGNMYNMQTLLDKTLAKSKKIIASAGSYTHSVEIALKDFEKLVQPLKGTFSKNKR